MGLIAPAALGLLGLLGVVALLHMLRVDRVDREVSSVLLWRHFVQDPPANRPWRRLKPSLLLLLQLAFLAALILALARPFLNTPDALGSNLVVVIDRSASMAATDVAPTRLDAAKAEVRRLVASAVSPRLTLIAFDEDMEVLTTSSTDAPAFDRALSSVQPVPRRAEAGDALSFAASLAAGQPDAQVILASDGGFSLPAQGVRDLPLRPVEVGGGGDNQGIRAVGIDQGPPGTPAELFVAVEAFGAEGVTRRVETQVDGSLIDARDIDLPPRGETSFTLNLPDDAEVVEVRLEGNDDFALDDRAWAVLPARRRNQAALVTPGNRFLETALRLLPGVESLTVLDPAAAAGPSGITDVAVIDGDLPARLPPAPLLLVNPSGAPGIDRAGLLETPELHAVRPEHPVVAGVDLSTVNVLEMAALRLSPEWLPVVVADADGEAWPALAVGTFEGRAAVLLAFDLRQSDLPLRPEFPLLVANAVDYLAPPRLAGIPASVQPGEPIRMRLPLATTAATVVDPGGGRHPLDLRAGAATFADTVALGVYAVEVELPEETATAHVAVDLAATEEGDLARKSFPALAQSAEAGAVRLPGRRELWRPLGFLALLFLCLEWVTFNRAGLPAIPRLPGALAGRSRPF